MNKRKQQQQENTDDYEIKRLQCVSSCLPSINTTDRHLITKLEDFSSEIFYEIFEFLDAYHIYKAFNNLNTKFQNLITTSAIPIQINFLSLSKPSFQSYYTEYIIPNKHRIRLFHLSNPSIIDLFSSSTVNLSEYLQLRKLIINDTSPNCLMDLLNSILLLPNLSSLSIHICHNPNKMNIYDQIFALPVLKYCKISFLNCIQMGKLPMCEKALSPIEHLVLHGNFHLNELECFLSYVLQLRHLSVKSVSTENHKQKIRNHSFILNHLISVALTFNLIYSDILEELFKYHFSQIQILYISTDRSSYYSNGERWEQLLSNFLPNLRVFDFHNVLYPIGGGDNKINETLIDQFNSPFFSRKNWFFTHEFVNRNTFSANGIVYSIQPYRRNYFILSNKLHVDANTDHQKMVLTSVRHLIIYDETIIDNCLKYFPNVKKLTLDDRCSINSKWYTNDNFRCIVPLTQITKLNINICRSNFVDIVNILYLIPNIHTLKFRSIILSKEDRQSLMQSETFRLVSKQNKINHITVYGSCAIGAVNLIIKSFPRLEHLILYTTSPSLDEHIPSLLSTTTHQLRSLSMSSMEKKRMEKLKILIESKMLSNDYSIKTINNTLYIWW